MSVFPAREIAGIPRIRRASNVISTPARRKLFSQLFIPFICHKFIDREYMQEKNSLYTCQDI